MERVKGQPEAGKNPRPPPEGNPQHLSGYRESNPALNLGKVTYYHYTIPARPK